MKKRIQIGLIAAGMLMGGCTSIVNYYKPSQTLETEHMQQIADAINGQKVDGIVELFSIGAVDRNENLEDEIEDLIALFPDGIDSFDFYYGTESSETQYGKLKKENRSWFTIYSQDQEYLFMIDDWASDMGSENNVGISAIHVMINGDEESRAIAENSTDEGIFIYSLN